MVNVCNGERLQLQSGSAGERYVSKVIVTSYREPATGGLDNRGCTGIEPAADAAPIIPDLIVCTTRPRLLA
jgi:hypothetical protein